MPARKAKMWSLVGRLHFIHFCWGRRATYMTRHEKCVFKESLIPTLAKTIQQLIAVLCMLKSTSEQSFGLKIGEEKCKLNQNICLKSRIINCGGFNMHLWFSVIIALRPKYIILSIFIPCRIEPSLLTLNQFMNGCFRKIKLPHPHQQFSEVLEERLEKRHFS